jgi:hypothetical protein
MSSVKISTMLGGAAVAVVGLAATTKNTARTAATINHLELLFSTG